jgi:hypothetical protein
MGEEAHPAKKLPVRVFNPAINDGLVAEVVLKLEDVQSDHQSGVDGRGTFSRDVGWMERILELLPIDFVGEADQGVIGINDGDKLRFEEVALSGLRGLGQHAVSQVFGDFTTTLEQKSWRKMTLSYCSPELC